MHSNLAIYQGEKGELEIKLDSQSDTIWLTQDQIGQLFGIDQSVVSRHISNTFRAGEVEKASNMQKMHNANSDKPVAIYSLDIVLSVGYRTSSAKAIKFRQWVNGVLKDYLQKGFVLNQKLLTHKQEQILEIQKTLEFLVQHKNLDSFADILAKYTKSLITLNQFDEDNLPTNLGKVGVFVEIAEFRELITKTKSELMQISEATELFGREIDHKFESSIGAIYQSFGGIDIYPSLQEKAAHLLYFIIKNHGFADGNKRIGAILFVYFLSKNNYLYKPSGEIRIDENTLITLALLVAQSSPRDKEILIKLIINLL